MLHNSEKRLELLGCVPGEAVNQKHMYGAIAESGGKLYLPPRNGKGIAVFNRQEKVFEKRLPFLYKPYVFTILIQAHICKPIFFVPNLNQSG